MSILPVSTSELRQAAAIKVAAAQADATSGAAASPRDTSRQLVQSDMIEDASTRSPSDDYAGHDYIMDRVLVVAEENGETVEAGSYFEARGMFDHHDVGPQSLHEGMGILYGAHGPVTITEAHEFLSADPRFESASDTELATTAIAFSQHINQEGETAMYLNRRPQLTEAQIASQGFAAEGDPAALERSLALWVDQERRDVTEAYPRRMGGLGQSDPVAVSYVAACNDAADVFYRVQTGHLGEALPAELQAPYLAHLDAHAGDFVGAHMLVRDDLSDRFQNRSEHALYGSSDPYGGDAPRAGVTGLRSSSPHERDRHP